MTVRYYANAPATTLAASCSNTQTVLSMASVSGFPIQFPYTLIIDRGTASEEAVSVTAASGTDLTVTRSIDGTTAFSHSIGATVEHGITAQDVREPNSHINSSTAVHGVTGTLVGTTDAQTLTNKIINLTSNTLTGTLAQFNAAVSDADLAPVASPAFTGNPTAPTPTAGDNDTSLATTAFVQDAINTAVAAAKLAMYPVGALYMSVTNTNPGTFLGGTWVAWGSGQVPVGVDTLQTEFNTVEKTGGEKTHTLTSAEIPAHTHPVTVGASSAVGGTASSTVASGGSFYTTSGTIGNIAVGNNTGGGGAHNNLQPYITCYMWKRTA